MSYEDAIKAHPELAEYSIHELGLIKVGMRIGMQEDAVDAIVAIINHMERAIAS